MVKGKVIKTQTGGRRLFIPKLIFDELFGNAEEIPVKMSFPKPGKMIVEIRDEDEDEKPGDFPV